MQWKGSLINYTVEMIHTYYHIISLQQYAIIALIECKQTTLTGEM